MRYTIPALPFLFVWMSKVGRAVALRNWGVAGLSGCSIAWATVSRLSVYPHSLSYFNELTGGPRNGHFHLLESNVACGQDLLYLRRWLDNHPEAPPLHLASFGWIDPRLAGIEFTLPPAGSNRSGLLPQPTEAQSLGPQPGWHLIDVNYLHGTHWPAPNGEGLWSDIPTDRLNYEYFLRFEPIDLVGYSIHVYHITLDEANRVRRELRLPELAGLTSN
jgi:hypothetical protein